MKSLFFILLSLVTNCIFSQAIYIEGPENFGLNNSTDDRAMAPFFEDQDYVYCYSRKTVSGSKVSVLIRVDVNDNSLYIYPNTFPQSGLSKAIKTSNLIIFKSGSAALMQLDLNTNVISTLTSSVGKFNVYGNYVIYENNNNTMTFIKNLLTNIVTEIKDSSNRSIMYDASYFYNNIIYIKGRRNIYQGLAYSIYKYNPVNNNITTLMTNNISGSSGSGGGDIYQSREEVWRVNDNLLFLMKDTNKFVNFYSINLNTQLLNTNFVFNSGSYYVTAINDFMMFNNLVYLYKDGAFYVSDGINSPTLSNFPVFFPAVSLSEIYQYNLELNNKQYGIKYTDDNGYELWSYDGFNNPEIVVDYSTGAESSFSNSMTSAFVHNSLIFCLVNYGINSYALLMTDGSYTGTVTLIDNNSFSLLNNQIIPKDEFIYFYGENSTNKGLFKIDYSIYLNNQMFETNDKIIVFPNPVQNDLNIKINNVSENTNVKIFDLLGKEFYSNSFENQNINIDLNFLKTGIYLLKINSGTNKTVQKIIKN
ncbi:T9SS type A sorting domain-containing protein [Flavobacterium haoranii]|uniref:Por secretion system C-terminal sorting domain-containing protein n=1 Tax=Flavobacterium haoranii TaxID=683124 RepID=A0A1M6FJM8_9FLAO|nr:T9SS type A sorting domain-containing protein [Flavobacterium haoranii]SHI97832.1 Por secretion system C-terminal sorting domain-containing protein [Flavobacterium haoranii]